MNVLDVSTRFFDQGAGIVRLKKMRLAATPGCLRFSVVKVAEQVLKAWVSGAVLELAAYLSKLNQKTEKSVLTKTYPPPPYSFQAEQSAVNAADRIADELSINTSHA